LPREVEIIEALEKKTWDHQEETITLNQDQTTNVNELNSEPESEGGVRDLLHHESDEESEVPIFLRDGSEGQKNDAQDEKDKTGE
jgi:hypothetical protein